jgi:hypothetical protein
MTAQRAGESIHSTSDVVALLKRQHEELRDLFGEVLASEGPAREDAFFALRRLLAVHETLEEEVVHPAARAARGIGEDEVDRRLREEKGATLALASLEPLEVDAPSFEVKFRAFQSAVLAHAATEEAEELDLLSNELDEEQLVRVRKAERLAASLAPEHPHPGFESTAATAFVGPFARLVDRARDLLGRRDADVRTPL